MQGQLDGAAGLRAIEQTPTATRAYMAAKRDDRLITTTTSQLLTGVTAVAATEESKWNAQHQELLSFQMLPMKLVEPTKRTPRDEGAEEVLFQHLVQYHNRIS
jgi:hypothetical protein